VIGLAALELPGSGLLKPLRRRPQRFDLRHRCLLKK
jgi:hypothetical protein